jgi:hypothetical protein
LDWIVSVEESEDPELLAGTDSTGFGGLDVLLFMVGGLYVDVRAGKVGSGGSNTEKAMGKYAHLYQP